MASINRQMRLLSQMCYSSLASQTTSIQWGIQGVDRKPWKTIKKEEPKSRNMQWTFLGCPRVGKRTYASRLSKPLGDPHIAIGDLVREELAQSGPPANKDTQICSVIFSNNCQESSAIPYCNQPVASSFHDIMLPSRVEKVVHNKKISELLQKYTQVIVCLADNVASNQLQSIRRHLRPDSVVLMGKNTVMKRSVERYGGKSENTSYENMVPLLVGNVALIFTRGNLREVCEKGALITKFGTRPLSRGLIVKAIYGGGSVFDPTVLDLIEDDSVDNISASISLWQPFFWLSTILQ